MSLGLGLKIQLLSFSLYHDVLSEVRMQIGRKNSRYSIDTTTCITLTCNKNSSLIMNSQETAFSFFFFLVNRDGFFVLNSKLGRKHKRIWIWYVFFLLGIWYVFRMAFDPTSWLK